MKKLVLLLTMTLVFVACSKKSDTETESKLAQKSAELAQTEAELAKIKTDLAKTEAQKKEEAAELAQLEEQKKLEEAKTAEKETNKTKTIKTAVTTPVDGEYQFQYNCVITDLSVGDLWTTYKSARAEAKTLKANGNLEKSIEKLLLAAECTMKLNRPDVAAWQFNNAGKQAIDLFVEKTGYSSYKSVHQSLYEQHKAILLQGKSYLNKAKEMDDKESDAKRTDMIERNLNFINNILKQIG